MTSQDQDEGECLKKAEEYQYLMDKSHQLFAGLRDLPQAGQKHWQPYFQRTFDVYTKLWKFQQQHRHVLENQKYYGLKRWEIGEIASKIGQLYYHYYLRTSETNYLQESYIFYEAIRTRGYFKNILESKSPTLVVRKLRYYARYVIVCLLLNRKDMGSQLLGELRQLVEQYSKVFRPSDAREWQLVVQEITTFMRADAPLAVVDRPAGSPPHSLRLQPDEATVSPLIDSQLRLKDAVLVGSQSRQVKFSELTLDMFRVMQTLEFEFGHDSELCNPHKYLLFRPVLPSLLLYLASSFCDLSKNGVLLLYVVADGEKQASHSGLSMNPGAENDADAYLTPSDLVPFSRKPLFVVIDSDCSSSFKAFSPDSHSASTVVLMSPETVPQSLWNPEQAEGLLTLFLSSSVIGFGCVAGQSRLSHVVLEKSQKIIDEYFEALKPMLCTPESEFLLPANMLCMFNDGFLRSLILRFVFCSGVLRHHASCIANPKCLPQSNPGLPETLFSHHTLLNCMASLVDAMSLEKHQFVLQ